MSSSSLFIAVCIVLLYFLCANHVGATKLADPVSTTNVNGIRQASDGVSGRFNLQGVSTRPTTTIYVHKERDLPGGLIQYYGSANVYKKKNTMDVVLAPCPVGEPISCFCLGFNCAYVHGFNINGNKCQCDYWGVCDEQASTAIRMICTGY